MGGHGRDGGDTHNRGRTLTLASSSTDTNSKAFGSSEWPDFFKKKGLLVIEALGGILSESLATAPYKSMFSQVLDSQFLL